MINYKRLKGCDFLYTYYENPKKHIFISHSKKTYNFASHFHNNLEVVFCFSGAQNIKIGEKIYTMKQGDATIIFPNIVHEYIEAADAKGKLTEIVAVILDNKLIADNAPQVLSGYPKNPFIKAELIPENIVAAFRKITETNNDLALTGWTYLILSHLLETISIETYNNDLDLAPKIIDYIDKQFKEDLNINYLAGVFGYSPSYIAHIFSNQLKIPFRTYLGAVRSEYAAMLIKTSKKSLTEIAYEAGYNSLNTFCRCFKKHFSQTPSQYKKAITK